ncbi:MAG: methionyl-tRNA formyltransferase [Candidatus Mucispirillum faecigallinarum]|nr:methionyl-tRNA formyltransferase [Candidatus Mucispirillum faecigallinarum]
MKKIVFMGTPEIAVPSLKALVENGFDIPLVITQPDKPKGRGQAVQFPPVKEYALSAGLNVFQPEKIKNNNEVMEKLKSISPDFFAVVAYGKILPQDILDIPKKAPVNVHFSLLPKYRGPAPVNWAIINGEEETGVDTMLMDAGMDTGDILLTAKTLILKKNAGELADELAITGAELLIKTLNEFESITPVKQDDSLATKAPMMNKEMGLINWADDAVNIERMIRAFTPWPAGYTLLDNKKVKIFKSDVAEINNTADPGTVIDIDKESFTIACGKNALKIFGLQIEGKKRMDTKSFLAGFKLEKGKIFG